MMGKKIAIIGCGYVGRAIAKRWKNEGYHLTVTTTSPEKVSQLADLAQRVKVVEGSDEDALRELCEGQDVILLSVASKGGRTEETYRASYLETTKNLCNVLRTNSTVKQVIYTSSYSVVGNHNGEWVNEETPDNPMNAFTKILKDVEDILLESETGDRRICVLRLGGIYGEGREILKIFRRAMGTTKSGAGAEYGNWIHLTDIVRSIEFAEKKQLSGLFNVVADEPMQRREMLDRLAKKYNLDPILWDETKPSDRLLNVRVSNKKLRSQGFDLAYPTIQL